MRSSSGASNSTIRQSPMKAQNRRGFTMVELLISVAIIGVLTVISFSSFMDFRAKAKVARAAEEIRILEKDIIAFASEKGRFPDNLAEAGTTLLNDPWGRPYVYKKTANIIRTGLGGENTDFDLYSVGPDGQTADSIVDAVSTDDIIRYNDGAYCGSAGKYSL